MTASDVLLQTRSRLQDLDYKDLRFSDNELLDLLHIAHTQIIQELKSPLLHFSKHLTSDDRILHTKVVLEIIQARFNGKNIDTLTQAYALKHPPKRIKCVSIDTTHFSVLPFSDGALEIFCVCVPQKSDIDEPLTLQDDMIMLLVLGTTLRALEIFTSPANAQKIQFFKALYQEELSRAKAAQNALEAKNIYRVPNTLKAYHL